jgi:hypothetical protein
MESTYYDLLAPTSYGGLSKFKPKGYAKKQKYCGTFASRMVSPNFPILVD